MTWNRIGAANAAAHRFQKAGLPVLVAENAAWGNSFAGCEWYTIANGHHNTAGTFPVGGPERWDSLDQTPAEWRAGGETVILPQRGIGSPPVAMPRGWTEKVKKKYRGRVRKHPGRRPGVTLEEDLTRCGRVITWGSGAAIKALLLGIPVKSYMPGWIGEQDNTDAGRLAMFRRLAWAQWRWSEIATGEAFERLLA